MVTNGVKLGEWTMDLEAAKAYASEHQLPVLLNFSGSDWCGWCQLMEEQVFSRPEWKNYAVSNLVMVLIDFPQDVSLVPEKYAARNAALQVEFEVEGFPSFIVLDDDGTTKLGRLAAGEEKTPESFQSELETLFRYRKAVVAELIAGLSAAEQLEYEALKSGMEQKERAILQIQAEVDALGEQAELLFKEYEGEKETLREFLIAKRFGEEKLMEFKALKAQLESKEQAMLDWGATVPENTPENMEKFEAMRAEMMLLAERMEVF